MSDPELIREHADECRFLWHQRQIAVFQPHIGLMALGRLDRRLLAHLDGLRVAGPAAIPLVLQQIETESSAAWAAAILCAEAGRLVLLDDRLAGSSGPIAAAAANASAWMTAPVAERAIAHWAANPATVAVAAQAAGHLGQPDARLAQWATAVESHVSTAAFGSSLRLGITPVIADAARKRALDPGTVQTALAVLALSGDAPAADRLLASLAPIRGWTLLAVIASRCASPGHRESVLAAGGRLGCMIAGTSGDPSVVPRLMPWMDDPRHARAAGEALSLITGVDLPSAGLVQHSPPTVANGPSEDSADADVSMDPDEDLPWPDRQAVEAWWNGRPSTNGRQLGGKPASEAHSLLTVENQRLRWCAAVESAISGRTGIFPVDAPALLQRKLLGPAT